MMMPGDSTHPSLILRLRDRADQLTWREFHERYGQLLYRYARSRGASDPDAEDIVQEVELSLFKSADTFEYDARKGRFRNYLRTAVIRALARRLGKEARQPGDVDPDALEMMVSREQPEPDAEWEREWQAHLLRRAMWSIADLFDPLTLKAFEMHVLGGRPVPETAELLGLSRWSVYQAKSRVLKRLRERLPEIDPDLDQ